MTTVLRGCSQIAAVLLVVFAAVATVSAVVVVVVVAVDNRFFVVCLGRGGGVYVIVEVLSREAGVNTLRGQTKHFSQYFLYAIDPCSRDSLMRFLGKSNTTTLTSLL